VKTTLKLKINIKRNPLNFKSIQWNHLQAFPISWYYPFKKWKNAKMPRFSIYSRFWIVRLWTVNVQIWRISAENCHILVDVSRPFEKGPPPPPHFLLLRSRINVVRFPLMVTKTCAASTAPAPSICIFLL
jgi:hypothetical protein